MRRLRADRGHRGRCDLWSQHQDGCRPWARTPSWWPCLRPGHRPGVQSIDVTRRSAAFAINATIEQNVEGRRLCHSDYMASPEGRMIDKLG